MNNESFRFDQPRLEDREEIAELFVSSRESGTLYPYEEIPRTQEGIIQWLQSGPVTDRIIVRGRDSIVAYQELEDFSIYSYPNLWSEEYRAEKLKTRGERWQEIFGSDIDHLVLLKRFIVAPEYQGLGIGEKMLRYSLERVDDKNKTGCLLILDSIDSAIRLYEKLGGKRIGDIEEENGETLAVFVFG